MEHSSQDVYEMRALVKGRVQGVGFRSTTRYYALNLGIKGSVRNLSDGRVEIYAQGSKESLEELIQRLQEEAGPGQVDEVSIEYFPIELPQSDFRILY